jgi:hypothetical protein
VHHGFSGSLLATCRCTYDLPTTDCQAGLCTSGSMGPRSSHGALILSRTRTSGVPLWSENIPSSLVEPVRLGVLGE